jgi:hypothetical protein
LLALVCVGVSLLAPASAGAAETAQIDILSPEGIEVSAGEEVSETVRIRNSGPDPLLVKFEVIGEYAPRVTPVSGIVFDYSIRTFALDFTPVEEGKEVSGLLVASAATAPPATIPFTASPQQETPWWLYGILFGSFLVAFALLLVRWLVGEYPSKAGMGAPIGPANWDFTKSWGSTLTVVGALLGTVLASSVLPDDTSIPKATYAALNFFFAALIIIGPFIYTATQRSRPVDRTSTVQEPQFHGYVWSFLLASCVTLWAALGEFGTILAVFYEIRVGNTMPSAALVILTVLLATCAILLLVMTWRRTRAIVEFQCDEQKQRELHLDANPSLREAGFSAAPAPGATVVAPELPPWSVL